MRTAHLGDDAALRRIDEATWSWDIGPAPPRPPGEPFFAPGSDPKDILVAIAGQAVVGYVKLEAITPLASHRHVLEIRGLATDPAHQRRGIGRQLLYAAAEEAARRGARRLRLHVLSSNRAARQLYESCGFEVEGILRDEFRLDGRYVDDVLMALDLTERRPQPACPTGA